ncbi:unnamed protein product [Clavelina lepadiformis]|uniref:DNA-directed DNA polymerase n=1 Tax=Clavelina lepadiformis TaxID=159417 RepID=A0ABP0H1I0_CLALP
MDKCCLTAWELPDGIIQNYQKLGLVGMFQWQAECLLLPGVLDGRNVVYSAPTSAGKSLVSEILILKRFLSTKKKAIIILPFVSVAREKLFGLKQLFDVIGIRVDGYIGGLSPPGGFSSVDVAICTIEKANSLINKLIEDKQIHNLGMLVVDELHMVSDEQRGYLIELLLTKIRFMCERKHSVSSQQEKKNPVQIVGMSATVPNLELVAFWLDATLYQTNFRPVPLEKCVKIGHEVFDECFNKIRDFTPQAKFLGDEDNLTALSFETLKDDHSVLIFCPTKNWCEKLAKSIAHHFYQLNNKFREDSSLPYLELKLNELQDVVEQLQRTPSGLDETLIKTIPFGVAFHHAGLTTEERDIIEAGFRNTAIRVLVATSTLSSGVNLPARRVIIRSPMFNKQLLDVTTYHQMAGRAGRKGIDDAGESILICKSHEKSKGLRLLTSKLNPVKSCLIKESASQSQISAAMKRAVLEIIVNGLASTYKDVQEYMKCTLLFAQLHVEETSTKSKRRRSGSQRENYASDDGLKGCIQWLQDHEFIYVQNSNDVDIADRLMVATQLGRAALMSSLPTAEALRVLADLQTASKAFALDTELHLVYLVTPIYSFNNNLDWYGYLQIYENLCAAHLRVADLIGVEERFLTHMAATGGMRNYTRMSEKRERQINIHTRFYASLILHELVQETPLSIVSDKYNGNKGMIQSLQQSAATFAGMVTTFCQQLGWWSLEVLLKEFQSRLIFGVQRELLDLTQITLLNNERARALYAAGLTSCSDVAQAKPSELERILRNANKFMSKRQSVNPNTEETTDVRKTHTIRIPGSKISLTEEEAAVEMIKEAKSICNVSSSPTKALNVSRNSENCADLAAAGVDLHKRLTTKKQPGTLSSKHDEACLTCNLRDTSLHHSSQLISDEANIFTPETKKSVNISRKCMNKKQFLNNCDHLQHANRSRSMLPSSSSPPTYGKSIDNIESRNQSKIHEILSPNLHDFSATNFHARSSLTESQIAVVLGDEFSVLHSQALTKTSQIETPKLQVACSTPVAQSSAKSDKQPSIMHKSSFNNFFEGLVADEKDALFSSFSFNVNDKNSSDDEVPSKTNHSNDMFSVASVEKSKYSSVNFNQRSLSKSVNWSSESVFNCAQASESPQKLNSEETIDFLDKDSSFTKEMMNTFACTPNASKSKPFPDYQNTSTSLLSSFNTTRDIKVSQMDTGSIKLIKLDGNKTSLKKFFKEWANQSVYAVSIGSGSTSTISGKAKCDSSQNKENLVHSDLVGKSAVGYMSIYWGQSKVYYLPLKVGDKNELSCPASLTKAFDEIKRKLQNYPGDVIITHSIKYTIRKIFQLTRSEPMGCWQDAGVAVWMLEPKYEGDDVVQLIKKYVPQLEKHLLCIANCESFYGYQKLDKLPTSVEAVPLQPKVCMEAFAVFHVMKHLQPLMKNAGMWDAFTAVEMPHATSVALMEENGLGLDMNLMKLLKHDLQKVRQQLQQQAWKMAGRKFNLSSPVEIGKILFGELGLNPDTSSSLQKSVNLRFRKSSRPSTRKTSKSWSTSKEVLKALSMQENAHPLPKIIMNWRSVTYGLYKVIYPLSTVLPPLALETAVTRFHPTALICTSTGRVSMAEPNMQNMPKTINITEFEVIRQDDDTKYTFDLRDLITAFQGYVMVSADYSQLELRMMAHMSEDDALLHILNSNGDVFRMIASQFLEKLCHEVNDEERTTAKRICYGILYGMSALTLSKQMNTSETKAQIFIDHFMTSYPKLQSYLRKIVDQCRKLGYITTVNGRRRHLPDITSSSLRVRSHAERQAVNSTIQGSAADLVKSATCKIISKIRSRGWSTVINENRDTPATKCYFIHHIHDEIMFEVESHLVNEAAIIIRDSMLNALPLKVRLAVKIRTGPSWGKLTDYEIE